MGFECIAQMVNMKGVLGNPLFHLLAGLIKFGSVNTLGSGVGSPTDEFARAVIGGGIEILKGESEVIINKIKKILNPPVGYQSWDDCVGIGGATSDTLAGATGWCRLWLEEKNVVIPDPK